MNLKRNHENPNNTIYNLLPGSPLVCCSSLPLNLLPCIQMRDTPETDETRDVDLRSKCKSLLEIELNETIKERDVEFRLATGYHEKWLQATAERDEARRCAENARPPLNQWSGEPEPFPWEDES